MRFPEPPASTSTRFANLALGLDAAVCNIAGMVFTLTGAFMADWLGVAGWVATVAGIIVLLWSFVITLFANRRVSRRHEVDLVMRVNIVAAIIASAVVAWPGVMTSAGKTVMAIAAAICGGFAIAQAMARRTLA